MTGFDFAPTNPRPTNSHLLFAVGPVVRALSIAATSSWVRCATASIQQIKHGRKPFRVQAREHPPEHLVWGIPPEGQEGLEPVILGMTNILNIDPGSDITNKSTDHQNKNSLQQMAFAAALPLGARSTINPIAAPAGKQKSR